MKILLIETSSESALLALLENGQITYELSLPGGPELSKVLGAEVQSLLSLYPPPYDRIVVGLGPGSFTGVRVGASMASALAFGWQIPLYTTSSLTAFGPGTVAIDARMGGIYIQEEGQAPKLLPLSEATHFLSTQTNLSSPHPEKILARIGGLSIEKREPSATRMIENSSLANQPLKPFY